MRTASGRARIEAHEVHGDQRSRTRDVGSHPGAERAAFVTGKKNEDCGLRRALIASRHVELHEAEPGHDPRLPARLEG